MKVAGEGGSALRRIISVIVVVALMAAMMVAMAAPAFAQAQHFEQQLDIRGNAADCQGVATPSGRGNAKCSIKEPGNNEGGSGGGGANVNPEEVFIFPTGVDPDAHLVQTPSGNQNLVGHDN